MRKLLMIWLCACLGPHVAFAQDRDTKVRNDRKSFEGAKDWIYNNLDEGRRAARESGKPLLVVFRCIPCEACQEFDDDVARRDPIIRDLMDRFVCVRIPQANTIDLTHFQFDFDQSFAVFLTNHDLTIYGRFGTRSERPEWEDISLHGLRKAMEAALAMHADYEKVRPTLTGKQVAPSRYKTPRDYPGMAERYQTSIDYQNATARSCMHCHQIRDAERKVYRASGEGIPDQVLYPYPDPAVVGLKFDPAEKAKIKSIAAGSSAERDGFRVGDEIVTLAGQPLLSIADVQWVLHNAPATAQLPATVRRGDQSVALVLNLRDGWRRGDISWRVTSWELRRMALGGMRLDPVSDRERTQEKLPAEGMALRVRHVGEFGEHAVAKRAGVQKGDIVVAFDGNTGRLSESDLMAYAVQRKRPGDVVAITVIRSGERKTMNIALQ